MEQQTNISLEAFDSLKKEVDQLYKLLKMRPGMSGYISSDEEVDDIFPIETIEELDAFEAKLQKEREFCKRLVIFNFIASASHDPCFIDY